MSEDYKKRFCETFAKRFEIDIENRLIDDYWFLCMEEKDKEIERLHSIIKEVREEIIKDRKKNYGDLEKKAFYCNKTDKLLEILDKENKE